MDIHSVRQELRTKSIYEIPLRVTYYARVSSESDEQLNSLGYGEIRRGHSYPATSTRASPASRRSGARTSTA